MKCLIDHCENEAETDDNICRSHWEARVAVLKANGETGKRQAAEYYGAAGEAAELTEVMAGWPGRGPDDDGEIFEPMSEEDMAAAQARNATLLLVDPFETASERVTRNWPNLFDSSALTLGAGW